MVTAWLPVAPPWWFGITRKVGHDEETPVSVRCIAIGLQYVFFVVFVFPSVNKWSALQAQNTSLAKNNNRNRTRPVTEVTLGGAVQGVAERRRGKGGGGDQRWRDGKDIVAEWPLHCVLSSDGGEVLHMRSIKHLEALVIHYWQVTQKKEKKRETKATYISQTFRKVEIKQRKRKQPTDIHTQTRQCFSIKNKKKTKAPLSHICLNFFFFSDNREN